MKRALIAQGLHLNRLYIILLRHPLTHHVCFYLQPVTAVFHCCTCMQLFGSVWIGLLACVEPAELYRDPARPLLFLPSQWKAECCQSALPLLLRVSEAPVLALGGASGSRLEDPATDVGHNLQMLACIRAWQLVMSPPPLPHSSITSHLLPNTSWGRWGGMEAGSPGRPHPSARRRRCAATAALVRMEPVPPASAPPAPRPHPCNPADICCSQLPRPKVKVHSARFTLERGGLSLHIWH